MNIKITKQDFDYIINKCEFIKITIGSHLYKTNTENSDKDILIIYESFHKKLDLFYPNFHQFQYDDVENNIQYILTSKEQFYRNLFSGDSTINVDVVMFYLYDGSNLNSLSFERTLNMIRTYNIIRAFIGFAKRDIKMFKSSKGKHKLFHIERGLYCANELMENRIPDINQFKIMFDNPKILDELCLLGTELHGKCTKLFEIRDLTLFPKLPIIQPKNNLEKLLIESNNIKEFKY